MKQLDKDVSGIIVRSHPSGDSDLVLKIVTSDHGKISVLAKHARKSRKRFSTAFDVFDSGTFSIRRGRGGLPLLTGFYPRASYHRLRDDLDKLALASLLCECFDALVHDEEECSEDYLEILSLGLEAVAGSLTSREGLKAVFYAISNVLDVAGLGGEAGSPSSKGLFRMLARVEQQWGRALSSRAFVSEIVRRLESAP